MSIVFRHLIRLLRGNATQQKEDEFGRDWTDRRSQLWSQIKENPAVPYNLNVLLEGMSLKNSRNKLLEMI